MQILQSTVALGQQVSNVLGKPQKQKLRQDFDFTAGKETLEIPIVLQLSEGTLCLNRTVAAQQLSFHGGNVVIRILAQILKFPADKNFLALFAVFSLATGCTVCSEKMLSAWHDYLMYVKCNELKIVIVEKNQENVLLQYRAATLVQGWQEYQCLYISLMNLPFVQ